MNISSFSDLSSLLQDLAGSGRSRGFRRSERGRSRSEQRSETANNRRSKGKNKAPETAPAPSPTNQSTTPPATGAQAGSSSTPATTASTPPKIDELAALYVKQYESNSGVKLSEKEFQQKKADVANFYSRFSDGTQRLDNVVFANDSVKA